MSFRGVFVTIFLGTVDHRGFTISKAVTAANYAQCHKNEYDQYLRSRHAAPAWAAVSGKQGFTAEQAAFSEQYHKRAVDRPPQPFEKMEGATATAGGCQTRHDVGRPNKDGSIGSCTACHARHVASVEPARTPETCGQCHMGPDHSQIEIYHESKQFYEQAEAVVVSTNALVKQVDDLMKARATRTS